MQKVEIELDETILQKSGYDVNKVYNAIDNLFKDKNIILEKSASKIRTYKGSGDKQDFGAIWVVNLFLEEQEWFTKSVVKWLYYNSDGNDDPNDFLIEDIIKEWAL